MPLLEVEKITKSFGGLKVLNNLDLTIEENEIMAIIGPKYSTNDVK